MVAFGRVLRPLWFFDSTLTFLNHGAYGATPKPIVAAQNVWREELEGQPVQFMDDTLGPALRRVEARLSKHVGAIADHLVLACNVSEAMTAVARSTKLLPGDEVLITDQAHSGVCTLFSYLCLQAGASLRKIRLPFPLNSENEILDAVGPYLNEKVRLAVFEHVSSRQSVVFPIQKLVNMCHQACIPVLVDGAHAPGMLDLDVSGIDADWYVGSCHKWLLAPKGSAFLVVKPDKQDEARPAVISTTFNQGFRNRFSWTGTRDPSAWLSISDALDIWTQLGPEEGRYYMRSLANWAGDQLVADLKTERGVPSELTGAMVSVRLEVKESVRMKGASALRGWLLEKANIEVPIVAIGDSLWVRISTHVYNDEADITLLSKALKELR